MLTIRITTIPHAEQRYPTVGDFLTSADGTLNVRISEMSDWRREFLVALHELVECMWARHNGVTEADIDAFDIAYEQKRQDGDESEPGNDPACPVYAGHQLATVIERLMAHELGVDWQDYDREVTDL